MVAKSLYVALRVESLLCGISRFRVKRQKSQIKGSSRLSNAKKYVQTLFEGSKVQPQRRVQHTEVQATAALIKTVFVFSPRAESLAFRRRQDTDFPFF